MKNKKTKNSKKVNDAIKAWREEAEISTDALGSYTGVPSDNEAVPEQDADDL